MLKRLGNSLAHGLRVALRPDAALLSTLRALHRHVGVLVATEALADAWNNGSMLVKKRVLPRPGHLHLGHQPKHALAKPCQEGAPLMKVGAIPI